MELAIPFHGETDHVLVESSSHVKTLILNRPQKLNALSYPMISQLLKSFKAYEKDSRVKLIILKGNGRAFSAGGDVAAAVRFMTDGHWSFGTKFYQKQLSLNHLMATYKKPQVSLINGIVMGGGAGVSVHGKFRVVTEKAVFAMPETELGLFPDVGASHFLSRLPGFFGEYTGLTGARLNGADMLACGLATHFVPSKNLPLLETELNKVESSDPGSINAIIEGFAVKPVLKENSSYQRLEIINRCFSKGTMEEILSALEHENINGMDEWITATIKSLKKASPLSLKLFLRSIREGRMQNIDQCLIREYRALSHIFRRTGSNDFYEGSRAILFDKDRKPKWNPSKLELVGKEMVDQYFTAVADEDWEELQLPARPNPVNTIRAKL